MFNDVGRLAETDKPTKASWSLHFPGAILRKNGEAQTAAIGTLYGLLFAGLLLMPFQAHRATAASPSSDDTVEA